ncbi:hypothetical protein RCL1_009049 [Eukaryota sp. TZLM3-RCL]
MRLLLLSLFVAAVLAGCICPSARCKNMIYTGTIENCFCFCQQQAKTRDLSPSATCTFSPRISTVSSGYCALCDSYIPASNDRFEEYFFATEDTVTETIAAPSNADYTFPVRKCKCPNVNCNWGFSGTYEQCIAWARDQAKLFIDGKWSATYVPKSFGFPGACSVCGPTDPCKPPF